MRIYGHRGLRSDQYSENTTAATMAALAAGADGVEVDLRLTADDTLVVCHDPDLRRLTGRPEDIRAARDETLAGVRLACGSPLARLRDIVAATLGSRLIVELKHDPAIAYGEQRLAGALARELRELRLDGMMPDLTVSSFHAGTLAAVAALRSQGLPMPTALLGGRSVALRTLTRTAQAAGMDQIHPHVLAALDDPSGVRHAQVRGLAVVLWTVNHPHQVRASHRLGADGVITDLPSLARRALRTSSPRMHPVASHRAVPADAPAHVATAGPDRREPALP